MEMQEYQSFTNSIALYPGQGTVAGLTYTILGLVGEAGELANKVKKVLRDHEGVMSEPMRDSMAVELGDVLWYVSQVAMELDIALDTIAGMNIYKLKLRKKTGTLQGDGDKREMIERRDLDFPY